MNRYPILIASLILVLFAVHDGYTQTATTVSKDVVIALDSSGSMKSNDPEMLISEVTSQVLNDLPEGSRVSLITFSGKAVMAMPLTSIAEGELNDKVKKILEKLTYAKPGIIATVRLGRGETLWDLAEKYYGDPYKWSHIQKANNFPRSGKGLSVGTIVHIPVEDATGVIITGEERTNIPAAVERAIYELKQNGRAEAEKQIVLITDGIIDVRDSALAVERYRWLKEELASDSRKAGIRIFSVALSEQADFDFMQSLAQKTNGDYYRVFKAEDVQVAINGIQKATLKPKPAPQPEVEVVQAAKTTPVTKPAKGKGGFAKVLLVTIIVVGLAALSVAIFIFIKSRKDRYGYRKAKSVPGAYLMDLSGITEKSNYPMYQDFIKIGRPGNPDVSVCIDKGTVSGEHAQIVYRDSKFYLSDLGSTNGTYINNEPDQITGEVLLEAGDIISFDQYKFKLVVRGQGESTGQMRSRTPGARSERPSGTSAAIPNRPAVPAQDTGGTASDSDVMKLEAYLEDTTEVTDKKSHRISKRITRIGRAKVNSICIDETTISASHAQIEYEDNDFYLTDLGSRNGTYLNEERQRITSKVRLTGDDVIYFDQYKFKFMVQVQGKSREAQLSASSGKTVSE